MCVWCAHGGRLKKRAKGRKGGEGSRERKAVLKTAMQRRGETVRPHCPPIRQRFMSGAARREREGTSVGRGGRAGGRAGGRVRARARVGGKGAAPPATGGGGPAAKCMARGGAPNRKGGPRKRLGQGGRRVHAHLIMPCAEGAAAHCARQAARRGLGKATAEPATKSACTPHDAHIRLLFGTQTAAQFKIEVLSSHNPQRSRRRR